MTGTTVAQAIPIAIMPILTRLYSPEDFGVLALFVAVTAVLGSIANGRYELAIMLPAKDEDAINVAALGLIIALCFSLILLITSVLLNDQITNLLGNQEIGLWLYLVPFVVLMIGLHNVLKYLNTRKKLYKDLSKALMYRSTVGAMGQVFIGLLKSGETGLIIGQILSQIVANVRLSLNVKREYKLTKPSFESIVYLSNRYKEFFIYSSIGALANTSAQYIVNILISSFYNLTTLGFYYLAQRVLVIPSAVAGSSFSEVFYQAATKEKQKTGSATGIYKKTLFKLCLLSVLFFLPMYFLAEELFVFFFGTEWRFSGEIAILLLPLIVMQFIASTLSAVFNVFEKQKTALIWQVLLLLVSVLIILVSTWLALPFLEFLAFYSWGVASMYVLYAFLSYKIARGRSNSK